MQHLEVRWPCSLSPAATDLLLQSKQIFNLKPNDDFSLGKGSEHGLAHVLEGLVIGGMTASRRPSPFVLFDAGSWFGGSQIYEKSAFRYSFVALGQAKLLHFPAAALRAAAQINSEIYKLLYFVTSEPALKTVDMLFASAGMKMPQRVAYFLWELAKRFPQVRGSQPMISISQTTLAKVLGLSRPKLNQELHALEQLGAISISRKKLFISDPGSLRLVMEDTGPVERDRPDGACS